jgi:hypothetical protein
MDNTTTWFYSYAQTLLSELPIARRFDDEDFIWLG